MADRSKTPNSKTNTNHTATHTESTTEKKCESERLENPRKSIFKSRHKGTLNQVESQWVPLDSKYVDREVGSQEQINQCVYRNRFYSPGESVIDSSKRQITDTEVHSLFRSKETVSTLHDANKEKEGITLIPILKKASSKKLKPKEKRSKKDLKTVDKSDKSIEKVGNKQKQTGIKINEAKKKFIIKTIKKPVTTKSRQFPKKNVKDESKKKTNPTHMNSKKPVKPTPGSEIIDNDNKKVASTSLQLDVNQNSADEFKHSEIKTKDKEIEDEKNIMPQENIPNKRSENYAIQPNDVNVSLNDEKPSEKFDDDNTIKTQLKNAIGNDKSLLNSGTTIKTNHNININYCLLQPAYYNNASNKKPMKIITNERAVLTSKQNFQDSCFVNENTQFKNMKNDGKGFPIADSGLKKTNFAKNNCINSISMTDSKKMIILKDITNSVPDTKLISKATIISTSQGQQKERKFNKYESSRLYHSSKFRTEKGKYTIKSISRKCGEINTEKDFLYKKVTNLSALNLNNGNCEESTEQNEMGNNCSNEKNDLMKNESYTVARKKNPKSTLTQNSEQHKKKENSNKALKRHDSRNKTGKYCTKIVKKSSKMKTASNSKGQTKENEESSSIRSKPSSEENYNINQYLKNNLKSNIEPHDLKHSKGVLKRGKTPKPNEENDKNKTSSEHEGSKNGKDHAISINLPVGKSYNINAPNLFSVVIDDKSPLEDAYDGYVSKRPNFEKPITCNKVRNKNMTSNEKLKMYRASFYTPKSDKKEYRDVQIQMYNKYLKSRIKRNDRNENNDINTNEIPLNLDRNKQSENRPQKDKSNLFYFPFSKLGSNGLINTDLISLADVFDENSDTMLNPSIMKRKQPKNTEAHRGVCIDMYKKNNVTWMLMDDNNKSGHVYTGSKENKNRKCYENMLNMNFKPEKAGEEEESVYRLQNSSGRTNKNSPQPDLNSSKKKPKNVFQDHHVHFLENLTDTSRVFASGNNNPLMSHIQNKETYPSKSKSSKASATKEIIFCTNKKNVINNLDLNQDKGSRSKTVLVYSHLRYKPSHEDVNYKRLQYHELEVSDIPHDETSKTNRKRKFVKLLKKWFPF